MKERISSGRINCILSAIIVFGSYIVERVLSMGTEVSKTSLLVQAFCFTLATGVVFLLISKSEEPYYGIIMALFGIRMMPPEITAFDDITVSAGFIYFIVQKFALILFIITIIYLYRKQKGESKIPVIPILATACVVPFFNEIMDAMSNYLIEITGNMLYVYFSQFAIYSGALLVLLFIALRSNNLGARLICDFQLVALALNIGRRACAVVITTLVNSAHISRSYYCWIAIYVVFFIAFYIVRKKNVIEKI